MIFSTLKCIPLYTFTRTHCYNRKCFAWSITLQLCKRSYSPPKKGTNNPQLSAKPLTLKVLVYHPLQNSSKPNAAWHTMIFFSIFNSPSTFATSHTNVIQQWRLKWYSIFPFSILNNYWACAYCFSKEVDSLAARLSSTAGKAFLRLKSTVCLLQTPGSSPSLEGSWDGHCKKHPLILHRSIHVLLDSKW